MTRLNRTLALLPVLVLLLSGCGVGLHATTYTKELSPRDFDPASLGALQVRNLGIAPPDSGDTHTAGIVRRCAPAQ